VRIGLPVRLPVGHHPRGRRSSDATQGDGGKAMQTRDVTPAGRAIP